MPVINGYNHKFLLSVIREVESELDRTMSI